MDRPVWIMYKLILDIPWGTCLIGSTVNIFLAVVSYYLGKNMNYQRNMGSSGRIVTRLWTGWPGFNFQQGQRFFLFVIASRPALGLIQSPIQWVPKAVSLGVKQPGHEADHLTPSAEVRSVMSYTSTPPMHLNGMVLN